MSQHPKKPYCGESSSSDIISDLLQSVVGTPLGRLALLSVGVGLIGGYVCSVVMKSPRPVRPPVLKPTPGEQEPSSSKVMVCQTPSRSDDQDIIATPDGCALPWDYMT